ncbi:MAG: CHAP domain-containing protein [Acidimicrobiales bacterium]
MAAGAATPARTNWAGWITPLLAMSAALFVLTAVLAPLGSATVNGRDRSPVALDGLRPAHFQARRTVGSPGWWKGGNCDTTNYPGSHPLGALWHGLVACGPGPTQGGSDHEVAFFPGAWGELEWECVELSMRWMYLAWGVNPYPANGWDVVRGYNFAGYKAKYNPNGPQLVVINNGTIGAVPQPGDVISVARTQNNPYGHTAVVTANAVNPQGNGTITLIQQNGGAGNDGWATYPVENWVVGDDVSGWLHNPAWTFQRPVIGFSGPAGFTARIAKPGNAYQLLSPAAASIAVAGDAGTTGTNGNAVYGYVDPEGDFFARRAASSSWTQVAKDAVSIAVALSASGTPVLSYLSTSGDFYAEEGSLTGAFTLEATGVSAIALAGGSGTAPPLLGYLQIKSGAFLVKAGLAGNAWAVAQASGVRSIALAEGDITAGALVGYVSTRGMFYAKQLAQARWNYEATNVTAISLAEVGPLGEPLLGYLSANDFYAGEGFLPANWVDEASGVAQMAAASASTSNALPVLGYVTTSGNVEVMQGPLSATFTVQAHGASALALSNVTDS